MLVASLLAACSGGSAAEKAPAPKPLTETQQTERINKLRLDFTEPVLIDSSVYVMYPLVLNTTSVEEGSSYGSSYNRTSRTYWNIIFYNTATGSSHLLADRKMVIYSYTEKEPGQGSSSFSKAAVERPSAAGINQVDKLLYYSVRMLDFNQDGEITEKDPAYLFASDKAGRNFRQLSPDGCNVESSEAIKGTSKILLRVTRDSDGNGVFNEKDATFPMVYDLNKGGASKRLFSDDFERAAKELLHSQWLTKPSP